MEKNTPSMLTVLNKKNMAIKSGAELLASKTNDWQTVRDYLKNRLDNISLTPKQQEKMARYKFVYEQISTGKSADKDVATELSKNFGVDIRVAYEDIRDAKQIYSEVFDINKSWELKLALDMNLKMLQKANTANDLKAYAALEKNRAKLLELVENKEDNPAEDFEGHTNIILFDPALIGAEKIDMKTVTDYIQSKRQKMKADNIEEAEVINEGE
jgi:hypothetical protein